MCEEPFVTHCAHAFMLANRTRNWWWHTPVILTTDSIGRTSTLAATVSPFLPHSLTPPPTQSTRATATTQQSPTAQTQQTHARRPLLASTLTRLSAAFAASPRACASQEEVLCLHSSHVVEVVDIARATVVAVVDLRSCCSLYYGLVPTLQCQTGSTNAHTHTHTHTHAHTRTHTHM